MSTSYNESQTLILTVEEVILSGETDSGVIDVNWTPREGGGPGKVFGNTVGGVTLPAGFTGTGFNILTSTTEGGTFVPIANPVDGGDLLILGAADQFVPIDPVYTYCAKFVKIRSNAAEGADRNIVVHLRKVT